MAKTKAKAKDEAEKTAGPPTWWQRAKPVLKKHFLIFAIMGMIGLNLEIAARWIDNDFVREHFDGKSIASAAGWSSLWMLNVYGIGGVVLGWMNKTWIGDQPMAIQVLIALAFMLILEFATGSVLNLWLGLRVWDYSWQGVCWDGHRLPLHVMGQCCLLAAGEFFLLSPLVFWLDDMIRWLVYGEPAPHGTHREPDANPQPDRLADYYRPIWKTSIAVAILVVVTQVVVMIHRDCDRRGEPPGSAIVEPRAGADTK